MNDAVQSAKTTYFHSLNVAREAFTAARSGRTVSLRTVKRAIQEVVNQVQNDTASILGMTTLRDREDYATSHAVNACILSVMLGKTLELHRLQLYELGLSALFHDIGESMDDRPKEVEHHPTDGLTSLLSMRRTHEVPYRAVLVAYEHHMKHDLSGYPTNRRPRSPTLCSRIVAIADAFDAAVSAQSPQHRSWPPDEVLRDMRDNQGHGLDKLLVKAFIHSLGVFPVGTLAILDSLELIVVSARNPDPAKVQLPIARVLCDPLGVLLQQPMTVDLSELDAQTGKPTRTIVRTVDPERFGIRISDYFV